jgi:phosphatidylinositol glycan class P protein
MPASQTTTNEDVFVVNESSRDNCGFVSHVLLCLLSLVYLLWVWVPDETLQAADITYYPEKSWAITVPMTLIGLFVATPVAYAFVNTLSVPSVDSMDTIVDKYTRIQKPQAVAPSR